MKISVSITLFFLLYICTAGAQVIFRMNGNRDINSRDSVDQCILRVVYKYDFPLDTISGDRYTDTRRLDIGNKYAHYYSLFAELSDSIMYKSRLERSEGGGINTTNFLKNHERPEHEDYYTNYPDRQTLTVWTLINSIEYIYSEPVPQFDWLISGESDSILGYNCIKATTSFRGRKYDVWFTTDIPMGYGPWKFSGLPGLILKAGDTEGTFQWTAIGLEKPRDESIYVYNTTGKKSMRGAPVIETVTATRVNVEKLKRKRWEDPVGLMLSTGSSSVKIMTFGATAAPQEARAGDLQFNYIPPLELE